MNLVVSGGSDLIYSSGSKVYEIRGQVFVIGPQVSHFAFAWDAGNGNNARHCWWGFE